MPAGGIGLARVLAGAHRCGSGRAVVAEHARAWLRRAVSETGLITDQPASRPDAHGHSLHAIMTDSEIPQE